MPTNQSAFENLTEMVELLITAKERADREDDELLKTFVTQALLRLAQLLAQHLKRD